MTLPPDRLPAIDRAMSNAFGTTDVESVTALTGGLSGAKVFRICVGGSAYLLRLEGARDVFRDPARWYACMRTAAEAFLAPRVRYACAEDGVAIMDFVPERPLALDYAGDRSELVIDLAKAVRALHATPAFPPLMDYLDAMDGLVGQLRASRIAPADPSPFVRYAEAAAVYRRLSPELVSSHNDLNPRNVLYDGERLWLIDWESSFRADRYVDLAAVANMFTSSPREEDLLLRTYFGADPDVATRARLFLARQINHVFYAVMFLTGVATERPDARSRGLDGPSVAELHKRLAEGEPVLDGWEGRLDYGRAHLAAASDNLSGGACDDAAAALGV
ncbi:MAG TPA: phosphotransferase [Labilithrix sp.]|nr:phosphotransferase [Labilithrix sp.]